MKSIRKLRHRILQAYEIISANLGLICTYGRFRHRPKIIYALTPPSSLKNVGDQAQAIAIHAWLKKHFPGLLIIETDKEKSKYMLPALRWLVQPRDVLFLHSGGNMGDRGMRSESIRRLLIKAFPQNKIVSLPQTIYFSDTPAGRQEREKTRQIYATHSNLTIIGRDPRSGELATELFPKAKVFCMPDFVLSMSSKQSSKENNPPKVLLCLRLDDESALTSEQRRDLANRLPYPCKHFDTTLDRPIAVSQRESVLESTLDLFLASDVVVTDRYHGLIFAVLCQKPCVVLRTVDHKLTSAMHWFKDVPFIKLAGSYDEVPALMETLLEVEDREVPDWNSNYFDKIPELVGLG